MKKNETCCGCDEDFKKSTKKIVKQVEGYTKTDREKKGRDVRAVFGVKKTTKKTEK